MLLVYLSLHGLRMFYIAYSQLSIYYSLLGRLYFPLELFTAWAYGLGHHGNGHYFNILGGIMEKLKFLIQFVGVCIGACIGYSLFTVLEILLKAAI